MVFKYSIIGAGCVGSVLAQRMLTADLALSLIATGQRKERLRADGLIVNGTKYMIPVKRVDEPAPDVLFICVKNYDLDQTLVDVSGIIDKHTIIIPLLNSVSPTPTIKDAFPKNRVLYGFIHKIDAYRDIDGYHYNIAGDIHFGDAVNEQVDDQLRQIQEDLKTAGFGAYVDLDMVRGVWKKWMLNVGANQVSALTNTDYSHFARIPAIEKILRLAMQELLIIAGYEGVNLSTSDIAEAIHYLTTYSFPKKTSMLQDIQAKRRTEVDYISGDIIRLSKKWNYPCPVNLTMYYLVKSKEAVYLQD